MKRLLVACVIVLALAIAIVLAHLAVIEIGREVVTLRTGGGAGDWQETRLWIVDDGEVAWLHSAGDDWIARFEGDPVVEVERPDATLRYRAHVVRGPHPHVDRLLREKYGLADRWVRFLAPCGPDTVPVRLEPVGPSTPAR